MTEELTYQPLKPDQRKDWNNFAGYLSAFGKTDNHASYLPGFKADNPDSKLTPEIIPHALNEIQDLKKGDSHPSMNPEQLKHLQNSLTPAYKNNASNINYPVSGQHGHDLEKIVAPQGGIPPPGTIPKPDYTNPSSRMSYAKQFTARYGNLMQGRGDTPLRVNESPDADAGTTTTAKEMSTNAAKKLGLDPATLYSSAMEEGMSGLWADKNGKTDFSGDEKYPISGFVNFGVDNFHDRFPEMVKKGYLSKDFANNFSKSEETNEKNQKVNSANFKDTSSALQAKAAMIKLSEDEVSEFAKKSKIPLSEKAKQFFTLVNYNAGSGNARKMLKEYSDSGYLNGDKFLEKQPSSGWTQPYLNTIRRIKMADALKKEGLFD